MTHYAIDAANRIIEKLEGDPTLLDLVQALATSCSALRRIQDELKEGGSLWRDIEKLAEMRKKNPGAYAESLVSIERFVGVFGEHEEEILQRSGATLRLRRFLFQDIERLLVAIREVELNPERVSNHVKRLRGSVCDVWDLLKAGLDGENRHSRLRRLVTQALKGTAGAGVIATNATADVIALGPWVGPVSVGVGIELIREALNQ